ncbi:hypothetical protein [Streptomyces sp. NPDC059918]|uniref:hypothetical protein n=1 Tax=unclassified Streptomyces TaxID=2593676 RepID=UPI00364FFAD6
MADAANRKPSFGPRTGRRRRILGCALASLVVTLPVMSGTTAGAAPQGSVVAGHHMDPNPGKPAKPGHPGHPTDPGGPIGETADVGVSVYGTEIQAVPNAVATQVAFSGAVFDTDGMFNAGASTLTVNTAGRYLVQGRVVWAFGSAPASAFRSLRIIVNNGIYAEDDQPIGSYPNPSQAVSSVLQLNEGDTISLSAFQTTGTTVTMEPDFDPGSGQRLAPQLQAELLS